MNSCLIINICGHICVLPMGQVTIYIDDQLEKSLNKAVKQAKVSKSKWIAGLIREKVSQDWPESVLELSGAWSDFPDLEEIRLNKGEDLPRESF